MRYCSLPWPFNVPGVRIRDVFFKNIKAACKIVQNDVDAMPHRVVASLLACSLIRTEPDDDQHQDRERGHIQQRVNHTSLPPKRIAFVYLIYRRPEKFPVAFAA